jgi:hypothetical protein
MTRFRSHAGYHEVEQPVRDDPRATEPFIPGEANAVQPGELGCFVAAANLPRQIASIAAMRGVAPNDAAREVVGLDRACPRWTQYIPGLDPRHHYLELSQKALEDDRRAFNQHLAKLDRQQATRADSQNKHLTKVAIWVAAIIGAIQILAAIAAITPETAIYKAWQWWAHPTSSSGVGDS